jgi:hypothetical protein
MCTVCHIAMPEHWYLRNGQHSALCGPHRPQTERNPVNLIFEHTSYCPMLFGRNPHLQPASTFNIGTVHAIIWKQWHGGNTISTCASDHMLRLLISSTLGCDVDASSFIGSPSGLNTRTSAPSSSRILRQHFVVCMMRCNPCRQHTKQYCSCSSAVVKHDHTHRENSYASSLEKPRCRNEPYSTRTFKGSPGSSSAVRRAASSSRCWTQSDSASLPVSRYG